MKKVLALVLAVMMLATVAMAAPKWKSSIAPSGNIKVDKSKGITGLAGNYAKVTVSNGDDYDLDYECVSDGKGGWVMDSGVSARAAFTGGIQDMLFRSVTTENYTVTNLKVPTGRSLVKGVTINDKEERVEVQFVDDLNNTTAKDFDLTFTLKGKGKMILRDDDVDNYNAFTGKDKDPGDRVTIPSVKFSMSGKVGYGKVEVSIGDETDEDIDNLETLTIDDGTEIDLATDVVKFVRSTSTPAGNGTRIAQAGAFTADAILTQEYGEALTLEARVYHNDVLFFDIGYAPNRDIVGRLADSDADMDFYLFNTDTKFTTFNSNAKLYFNDADEEDFVYQIKDQKLVKVGSYSEEDGCWVVKTRTLGQYVVSDVELKEFEATGSVDGNPDTGANDVVGIATALAAVALVSAAAVSLKK